MSDRTLRTPKKGKTAAKTATVAVSPLNGAEIPLGAHPANTGGKPGRSGRKADEFKAFCQRTLEGSAVRTAAEEIAGDKTHPQWRGAVEWLAKYGHHEITSEKIIRLEGVSGVRQAFDQIKTTIRANLAPAAAEGLILTIEEDLKRL